MKRTFTFYIAMLFISMTILSVYCKNNSGGTESQPPDTSLIVGVFIDRDSIDIKHDVLYRIIFDNIKLDTNDISKNIFNRDSAYYIPEMTILRDSTGKALLDSAGNPIKKLAYFLVPKSNVWDIGIEVDSAKRRFDKWLKKKDSLTTK